MLIRCTVSLICLVGLTVAGCGAKTTKDKVILSQEETVTIMGAVEHPGLLQNYLNYGEKTLVEALEVVGGVIPEADCTHIRGAPRSADWLVAASATRKVMTQHIRYRVLG